MNKGLRTSTKPIEVGEMELVIQNLTNSENSRLQRDGNTVPSQTQNSSKQQVSDLSWPNEVLPG